jgi:hypothetical protein
MGMKELGEERSWFQEYLAELQSPNVVGVSILE